jgi:CO/xanthine dehydrogenase Mo-binding subunit
VFSPYRHAHILHIETVLTLAQPGVVTVFTAETLDMAQTNLAVRAQTPLARQEFLWYEHPVAMVIGQTAASAEDGAAAVEVDYEPLPVAIEPEVALRPGSPLARTLSELPPGGAQAFFAHRSPPVASAEISRNGTPAPLLSMGDIEAGLCAAGVLIERSYCTNPVHQSYLEPQTVTVAPRLPERLIHVEPVWTEDLVAKRHCSSRWWLRRSTDYADLYAWSTHARKTC